MTALVQVWERLVIKRSISRRTYAAIVIVGFFLVASFMAWRDQYQRANTTQDNKEAGPDLQGYIQQSATGLINHSSTVLFLSVILMNRGAPTVAVNWRLDIKSSSVNAAMLPPTAMGKSDNFFDKVTRERFYFFEQGSIIDKASQRIERGSIASGWIKFVLKGEWQSQLHSKETTITLHFSDFTGKTYSLPFIPKGEHESVELLPGMGHH